MNNNKFYTAYLYRLIVVSIVVFGAAHEFNMLASFNDRIAKYWQWTIDESDKNNPIVYYKGQRFDKESLDTAWLTNLWILEGTQPAWGYSKKDIRDQIYGAFNFLADPANAKGIVRNYAKADLSAQLLDEFINKSKDKYVYQYRTPEDIQRYYKKWFVTRALLGVATLGIIDITYWQRDVIKDYLQNAVSSLFNRLLIKKAGS